MQATASARPDGLWGLSQLGSGTRYAAKQRGERLETLDLIRSYVDAKPMPEHGPLTTQMSALYLDEWWPVAVRLNDKCFFVRMNDDGPMPEIARQITRMLADAGLQCFGTEDDWPLVDGITLQRLGVVGASWEVWADTRDLTRQSINEAVMQIDSTPEL